MEVAAKVRGFSYIASSKVKIEYEYWLLFREFIFSFSRCAIDAALASVRGDSYQAELWRDNFLENASGENIEFAGMKLSLTDMVDLNAFDSKFTPFLSVLICLISQCGIRYSNAIWLDARSFDYHSPETSDEDTLAQLFINTDKTRLRPFQSYVPFKVVKLLRSLNDIRKKISGDEPIYYQNYRKSKWGEIVPLFRLFDGEFNEKTLYSRARVTLTAIVLSFESLIKGSGLRFESYIYPSCPGIPYDDYLYYKATRTTIPPRYFVVENTELKNRENILPRPVSIFEYQPSITLHSFRKTFDSFYSLFLSKEDIGKLFTGQSPQTVGFYVSNTVEEFEKSKRLASTAGVSFSIKNGCKDPQSVIDEIKQKGITDRYLSVSAAEVDEFDLDEEYIRALDKDIAVNRTHICPYNNKCPPKIRKILENRKLCGICPAALSFSSDGPAIAAKIKQLGDEIADLSLAINSGTLVEGEREELHHKRVLLLAEFSAWMGRHDQLLTMTKGQILIGESGHDHYSYILSYHKPDQNWSEEKTYLWRIFETAEVKTMQSGRLRKMARRYARRLIKHIDSDAMDKIEVDPVRVAALLIEKIAALNGLSLEQALNCVSGDRLVESTPMEKLLLEDSVNGE